MARRTGKARNSKGAGKWERRNFFATIFFGTVMAGLGLGQWFYPQSSSSEKKTASLRIDVHEDVKVTDTPLTPSTDELQVIGNKPTMVVDTRLTPGTGTLRL